MLWAISSAIWALAYAVRSTFEDDLFGAALGFIGFISSVIGAVALGVA